ncbi:Site-specific DNA recombinase [Haloechinothrix alba]|uniref:Site-specific DNA recombinase n=1 Tax=Haloechinothrix alba TaxID=664784 RepID=A0A238WTS4_9PSEU|nr:recombinase family protein [Haloechinothrix alba]SNR49741.1 Site-specific DNA recombinase [Haloechinothrix alba]
MEAGSKAREYLRVSVDASGRERSQDEQHAENVSVADRHGWKLGKPYWDTGSASRYATKAREGYDLLIKDLGAGKFAADVLIIWESSRGSRKVSEWVELIELCEKHGVQIHVTTHGRTYDPGNARDRRSLLEDSVDSEYESSKLSSRLRRSAASGAREGMPHGRCPYGYRRRYDDRTRKLIAQEPYEPEAQVVRELFHRLIKGHSLRAIAADFAERGIAKRSGGPFSAAHLRTIALSPLYAGLRQHAPGTHSGNTRTQLDATLYPATWPGLVSEADYYKVRRLLTDPARVTTRPGRGKHLLSMIARCGPCGGHLGARNDKRYGWQYHCLRGGCVRVNYAELNDYAEQVMLAYLARDDIHEALSAGDGQDDGQLAAIDDEIAGLRARLDELADAVAQGTVSVTLASRSEPQIEAQLRDAERRKQELATPSVLRDLVTPGADVARRWKTAEMSTKREVARLLLTPEVLGELRATRSPTRGHHHPITQRVEWIRQ